MNRIQVISLIFILIVSVFNVLGQSEIELKNVIATEYAFIEAAQKEGIKSSFLKFIADDGILFRPKAVNGKKFLENREGSPGLLKWFPDFAIVSSDGYFGFTTGPWEYRSSHNIIEAEAFGNFATVWQKQKDGSWKFVIDNGNNNEKPDEIIQPLPVENLNLTGEEVANYIEYQSDNELIQLEKIISEKLKKINAGEVFQEYLSDRSRYLRDLNYPVIGQSNITKILFAQKGIITYKPESGKISSSNDFGFTHGIAIIEIDTSLTEYIYFNVWAKKNGNWKLILNQMNELKK